MKNSVRLIIYWTFVHILYKNNVETSKIFPSQQMSIVRNHGFLVHILHTHGFKLQKCTLLLEDGSSFELDPVPKDPAIYNTSEGVQIQRFSQTECGVRVKNLASSIAGNWTLVAENDRKDVEKEWFMLDVLTNKVDQTPRIITVTQDNPSSRASCPNTSGARYCRIIDHTGNILKDQCDLYASSFGTETLYDCRTMRWGQMQEIKSAIKVVMEKQASSVIKGEIIETDKHIILTCKDHKGMCRAEMPQKKQQFLLYEGLLMDHYSTYDTDLNKGICSLEIEKPLKPEDIGTWRIYQSDLDDAGCVFRVKDETPVPQSNANDPKRIEVWNGKSQVTIECEVPYPIDYCYLSTPDFPDNTNFTSLTPERFFATKFLGICRFILKQPISGLYVCGVNSINGGEDIQTYYRVKVYDVPVQTSTSLVQGAKGQVIDLMVKTIFDYPMAYCRFMMPNGQVHGVSERFNMTGVFRFYAKGLQFGECGIQILTIKDEDFGVWRATVQVEGKEYHVEMVVTKQGSFSLAYVAGPVLAIVAISAVILGYFVHQKRSIHRRRRRYDRTVGTTTDDLDLDNRSEASHES